MQSIMNELNSILPAKHFPDWVGYLGIALKRLASQNRFAFYRDPNAMMIVIDLAESAKTLIQISDQLLAVGHNFTMNQLIVETSRRFASSMNLMKITGHEELDEDKDPQINILVSDSYSERCTIYLCHDRYSV